ncbi:hypothetical protein IFM89_018094 [Coptis chinensis]|uniref:ER membrane protein complex subunit 4 n=1 Tax=Coptis chinensis TaxID=261450 RepID=A0A835IAN4_9MAGN|nr:hypothetical protein IFM89_018094 [Coptis chinensis]
MKYVFVTGGVVSGLGKGVTTSSIGVVLKACGLRVTSIKIDLDKDSFAGALSFFLPQFRFIGVDFRLDLTLPYCCTKMTEEIGRLQQSIWWAPLLWRLANNVIDLSINELTELIPDLKNIKLPEEKSRPEEKMEKGKGVMLRRWAVELTDTSSLSIKDIPDPPGYTKASQDQDDSTVSRQKKDAEAAWKSQKAWEVAQAPVKNLFMMGFMMWMAGNTVHLFSIGITFSALWQPLSALQGLGKVFEPYKDPKVDTLAPKLVFAALNLAALLLGVWKLNSLGLLPTHASDWVSSLPPAREVEFSGGGFPLF